MTLFFCLRLKILKFENLIKLQIGEVMYLYKNRLLPESFNDMFLFNYDVHKYNTRTNIFFPLRYSRTIVKNFPFRFQGPKLFSSLSNGIQNASSIAVFTSKLKSSFLISIFTSLSRLAYASFATFISFFPFLCLFAFARLVVLNYLFLPHHC